MAFLDNSGDILLDAVLTDTGRFRLAKGDGSFKITKFAFADDEIDYSAYNKNHASGSAYYDLSLLQTPILEAFTNNTSTMKTKLISIARTNLLYLPVLKVNETHSNKRTALSSPEGSLIVAVDDATEKAFQDKGTIGVAMGVTTNAGGDYVKIDQGLDTRDISPKFNLDNDLVENQYIIELDSRLGRISGKDGDPILEESFIDDDMVATYFVSTADTNFVNKITTHLPIKKYKISSNSSEYTADTAIIGPRGTSLEFSIRASIDLNSSTYLFEKLGTTSATTVAGLTAASTTGVTTWAYIDTVVRISGATTGYKVDIPVRFVKAIP